MNWNVSSSVGRARLLLIVGALVCILGWLGAPRAAAFMPAVCFSNATVSGGSGVCCPVPKGRNEACGGRSIGSCERLFIQSDDLRTYGLFVQDDRFNWPTRFFSHLCKCEGNFFGLACNECYFGWTGPNCDQRVTYVRKNALKMTPKEQEMFVNVVAQMPKVMTEYLIPIESDLFHSDPMTPDMKWEPTNLHYFIAAVHQYASRSTLFKDADKCQALGYLDNNHNVVGFITWHRMLMLFWERELRKIAIELYNWQDFAIPYWDWVDAESCEPCTNSLVGAPGPWVNGKRLLDPESPFANWIEYCTIPEQRVSRCYGCHFKAPNFDPLNRFYEHNSFPSTLDLEFTLSKKTYHLSDETESVTRCRSFREALEGFCGRPNDNSTLLFMHNRVHNMVKGSMCCSTTASNDPLFILHHSQMDRIWQLWYRYYKPRATEYPNHATQMGNCRECNLVGFIPTVRHVDMFTDLYELGVDYDNYDFGKNGFTAERFLSKGPFWPETYWDDMYQALKGNSKPTNN